MKTFTIFFITLLLSATKVWAFPCPKNISAVNWADCTGKHTLVNGMTWEGWYKDGGPSGAGTLSLSSGIVIEGYASSISSYLTGLEGAVAYSDTKNIFFEGEMFINEYHGGVAMLGKLNLDFEDGIIGNSAMSDGTIFDGVVVFGRGTPVYTGMFTSPDKEVVYGTVTGPNTETYDSVEGAVRLKAVLDQIQKERKVLNEELFRLWNPVDQKQERKFNPNVIRNMPSSGNP